MPLPKTIALLAAIGLSSCVVISGDSIPAPPLLKPRIDSVALEGFQTEIVTRDAFARGSGWSSAGGTVHARAVFFSPKKTNEIAQFARLFLEDSQAVRRVTTPEDASLILRGSISYASIGRGFSIPYNLFAILLLLAPITGAREYTTSIRAYKSDGEFVAEYVGHSNLRAWYHWAWWSRLRAQNEGHILGAKVATANALAAFLQDPKTLGQQPPRRVD